MKIKFIVTVTLLLVFNALQAQPPMRGGAGMGQSGRFYGKIVDEASGKGLDAATVTLVSAVFDRATRTRKDSIVGGFLTNANGDFSIENVPFMGDYSLQVSAIGFKGYKEKVSFLTPEMQQKLMAAFAEMGKQQQGKDAKPAPNPMEIIRNAVGGDMSKMAALADKDLGNIKMKADAKMLDNVTVTGSRPAMTLQVDRRVFNVDKTLSASGSTAIDIMRQIPSVNVDIDGNVKVRNATPVLFVDGRPTTLTLEQIPADDIQSVELITNPSAKFDASGGNAAILNVLLKKNKKPGYNGTIRAGIDSRLAPNFGGDIAFRQGKINAFANASFNARKTYSWSDINTYYYPSGNTPGSIIDQDIKNISTGYFGFGRAGFDFLADNRNTFTFSGSYVRGQFNTDETNRMRYDTFYNPIKKETGIRETDADRFFRNAGVSVAYKHLFAKPGQELTADVNWNDASSGGESNFNNQMFNADLSPKDRPLIQKTTSDGGSNFLVAQTDFANPIKKDLKLEAGLRGQVRTFITDNLNYIYDYNLGDYVLRESISANYEFTDRVYAAYTTITGKAGKLGYNAGLRAESSNYDGELKSADSSFSVDFPLSLFPSAFLSYAVNDNSDVQFNYSRRVQRPNFFQLIPFIDYTDPLNLSVGNADLSPEFTNSFEANYTRRFNNNHNILISGYYKYTTNLLTRYQYKGLNPVTGDSAIYNTWVNANSSTSYGIEFTSTNKLSKRFDMITNANFYNASINSENLEQDLNNSQFSFFVKATMTYKMGKNNDWTWQLNGDYQSKTVLPVGGSGGFGRGPFGGNQAAGSNGFVNPNYGIDLSVKKDIIKAKNAPGYRGSLTLSVNDVLRTRIYDASTSSDFFVQSLQRRRDPQIFRLQFQYRFGKMDTSLFRRKNMKGEMEGMREGMQGM